MHTNLPEPGCSTAPPQSGNVDERMSPFLSHLDSNIQEMRLRSHFNPSEHGTSSAKAGSVRTVIRMQVRSLTVLFADLESHPVTT